MEERERNGETWEKKVGSTKRDPKARCFEPDTCQSPFEVQISVKNKYIGVINENNFLKISCYSHYLLSILQLSADGKSSDDGHDKA